MVTRSNRMAGIKLKTLDDELIDAGKEAKTLYDNLLKARAEITDLTQRCSEMERRCKTYEELLKTDPSKNTDTICVDRKVFKVTNFDLHHSLNECDTLTIEAVHMPYFDKEDNQ